MKKFLFAVALAATVISANAAEAKDQVIAVVDLQKVIGGSNAAKRDVEKLQGMAKKSQEKVKNLQKPLVEERKKLEQQRTVLSQEEFLEREAQLRKKINAYRNEEQDIQGALDRENLMLRRNINEAAFAAVKEIATKRKYSLVLQSNVTLYVGDTVDITADVLKNVNKRLDK